MSDEKANAVVERLHELVDGYEDEDIVGAATEAIRYINQLTVAYRSNRTQLKEVQHELSMYKNMLEEFKK